MPIQIQSEQMKIGLFIRELRELRGLTQEEFAKNLKTSQSAIARIKKGEQNLTTDMLARISEALNRKIMVLSEGYMDFEIEGGHKLSGAIDTNASKNGAMGLLCASLLNKGTTVLHGIPRIEEVNRMLEILAGLGVKTKWMAKQS